MFDVSVGDSIVSVMSSVFTSFLSWSPVTFVVMVILGIFAFQMIISALLSAIDRYIGIRQVARERQDFVDANYGYGTSARPTGKYLGE